MACKKRPVSVSQVESLVARISRWVQHSPEREMSAQRIGQAVIYELKGLDDVAFVRFASVYKNFRNVTEFVQSLQDAPSEKGPKWDNDDNLEN